MKFPSLETMVHYGVYTIRDLLLFSQNKLKRRNIKTLNECDICSYVYTGHACNNCSMSSV